MSDDSERPYRLGDGDREMAASSAAFFERLRAGRPAEITNAERDADKAEIAKLKAKTEMLQRVAERHAEHIRTQRRQIQTLTSAVAELQKRSRPSRATTPSKRRDGLDAALERELYE